MAVRRPYVRVSAGMVFGKLTTVAKGQPMLIGGQSRRRWWCTCECGAVCLIRHDALATLQAKSCGCSRREREIDDLTGRRFGSVIVVRMTKKKQSIWYLTKCDCGIEKEHPSHRIRSFAHESRCGRYCGDIKGKTQHELYAVWSGMRNRCSNPNSEHYADYGGRGIRVCERWSNSFADFVSDVGPRPPGKNKGRSVYSLDRIDVNGDYKPGNVRWANQVDQCANKRLSYERVRSVLEQAAQMQDPIAWAKEKLL